MSNWSETPQSVLTLRTMPDVAATAESPVKGALDWVGMSGVEIPVLLLIGGHTFRTPAKAEIYVSLDDANARGIHMSRLFLTLQDTITQNVLSPMMLRRLLEQCLASHTGISSSSRIRLEFEHMLQRPALVSDNQGWRSYPVVIESHLVEGEWKLSMEVKILYSSTCPCSAALARQLIQEQFVNDFKSSETAFNFENIYAWLGSERGIAATPHAQRSEASVRVELNVLEKTWDEFPLRDLIDVIEESVKTPVQTAVKREDEQEFARLNGQNLMFCEDAARRIQAALTRLPNLASFWIQTRHIESLHAHDAVTQVKSR